MAFPVILIVVANGITALVTYVGVRMAMGEKCEHPHDDAKDLDETAREGEDARETFYKARRLLEVRRKMTQDKLESLGRQKAGTFVEWPNRCFHLWCGCRYRTQQDRRGPVRRRQGQCQDG